MLFNPLSGPPWEYPAIKANKLIIPLKKIVFKTTRYSLLKNDTFINTSTLSTEINIVESPFLEDTYLIFSYAHLDGISTKPIRMKVIRQTNDKIELIGIGYNIDMAYSDYAMTIKIRENKILQIIYHNFEREYDYEFEGIITQKSKYDKNLLDKEIPDRLEGAVRTHKRDDYKPLLDDLLAKYPNYYKINYIVGVLTRDIYYVNEAIKLNKKLADAYELKLSLILGEGFEIERYNTLKLLIKYRRFLSPLAGFDYQINYLKIAELEKQFGNSKKAWRFLSKYFAKAEWYTPEAYYLKASLYFLGKKYAKALYEINVCMKDDQKAKNYLLRAQIKEAMGDIIGFEQDKKEAKILESKENDWKVFQ